MTSVSILPALEVPVGVRGYDFTGIKAVSLPGLNSVAWLWKRHLLTSESGAALAQATAQCGVTSPGGFQAVAGESWGCPHSRHPSRRADKSPPERFWDPESVIGMNRSDVC